MRGCNDAMAELLAIPSPEGNRALLPPRLHDAYDRMCSGISAMEGSIDLGMRMSDSETTEVLDAVVSDHPAFFWLSDSHQIVTTSKGTDFEPGYIVDKCEANAISKDVMRTVHLVDRAIDESTNDRLSIILSVHDHLCRELTYDVGADNAHSVLGAVNGRSVCDGISHMTSLMLNYAGIPTDIVCGRLKDGIDELHAWNIVEKKWHIDVTCDMHKGFPLHSYFMRSSDDMRRTHEFQGWDSSDQSFDYYGVMGLVMRDRDDVNRGLSNMASLRGEFKLVGMTMDECIRLIQERTERAITYSFNQEDDILYFELT